MTIIKGRQKLNIGPVIFSSTAAFLNIVKMNVGIGVLSMPNAVANAGWGLGAGSMALLNIMTIHCMLLLVRFFIRNVPAPIFVFKIRSIRSGPHRRYAGDQRYNCWIMEALSNPFSSLLL